MRHQDIAGKGVRISLQRLPSPNPGLLLERTKSPLLVQQDARFSYARHNKDGAFWYHEVLSILVNRSCRDADEKTMTIGKLLALCWFWLFFHQSSQIHIAVWNGIATSIAATQNNSRNGIIIQFCHQFRQKPIGESRFALR